ncbi:tRNA(fMet)-specific endonuclease VapC [Rhodoblastus acidophilus]|uniref:type II toxin-antitoxin system VapC family toxin n=1 Tax=Rhodoblastus acidophilus TaxID=1074 RepID=UPI0022241A6A|nr:type II toxin-antitoxin system VapC family toxin [Rhodoblastus acidophilus]MCW2285455.1 tRNA(fMet)-specific endonuclease VapC [Rhodoblastus acidophilus]MCW2334461.1 tRNA(fMet)-specific endonuclease VapC [Rhodoblastus acidophilus]
MSAVFMLDTNICAYIMRERPLAVLERLQTVVESQHSVVISVVTYYEMLLGTVGRKASPRHADLVAAFVARLSDILPWDRSAAEQAMRISRALAAKGTPIGGNDAMIAGHALAAGCVLVTNNVREFERVEGLIFENWVGER